MPVFSGMPRPHQHAAAQVLQLHGMLVKCRGAASQLQHSKRCAACLQGAFWDPITFMRTHEDLPSVLPSYLFKRLRGIGTHSCSGPRGRLLSSSGVLDSDCFSPALALTVLVRKLHLALYLSVWHAMRAE